MRPYFCGNSATQNSVQAWIDLHCLSRHELSRYIEQNCLISGKHGGRLSRTGKVHPKLLKASEAWNLASQALREAFPSLDKEITEVADNCFTQFGAPESALPCTEAKGSNGYPYVSMCFSGTAADILCVAHEFGHALQYLLADGKFVPPIQREIAAFVSELTFMQFAKQHLGELNENLKQAFTQDTEIFFENDANELLAILRKSNLSNTPYNYRMNYPVARAIALYSFHNLLPKEFESVFRGRLRIKDLIEQEIELNSAHKLSNYLPTFVETEGEPPATNAYRSLGMMALLDINYWKGESEKQIEEYYHERLDHMRNQTAFVAIGGEKKPIGYAIWQNEKAEASIRLLRQTAPFGDHLELQQKLEQRLPKYAKVMRNHSRSAQKEQVAW